MLARSVPFLLLLPCAWAQVALPGVGSRFVDFHEDLAHSGAVVVVGTLTKWKEGKRERLAEGQLGGGGQVASVSGTQYFQVPVTASLRPRATLHGKADDAVVTFDVQVARLPDGKERRQMRSGTPIAEDQLALFVVLPRPKKGFELRHVIVFDPATEEGAGAEAAFADSMRDYYTVNRRMCDLTQALAKLDAAKDEAQRQEAATALRELLAAKPELKAPKNDQLLTQHVAPLEKRAEKRLAEIPPADAAK